MLGRGLESLIPNKSAKKDEFISAKTAAGDSIFQIEVDKISFNPFQPRKIIDPENLKELAASIREMGIIQPILVSKSEVETSLGTEVNDELIAGQRRLMAAKLL
jgi:ParB family chromosome partitioning protein